MKAETYAVGFFLYGALCTALIGAGAILWHDPAALALLLLGGLATTLSYMFPAADAGFRHVPPWLLAVTIVGWALPIVAAVKLVLRG